MIELDHIAIAGETRDAAADYVRRLLGVELQAGGQHAHFGTHNHLMGLADGLYLEAISIDPDAPKLERKRWFALDDFKGASRFTNWICRTQDIEALVRDLPEAGEVVSLERGDLKWRMAVPKDGRLPFDGCFPAVIQWDCPDHPAGMLSSTGCAIEGVTVCHPAAAQLQNRLAPYLKDARITFKSGSAGLTARIATPKGVEVLR
jgi:hypothetical protein